MYRTKTGAVIDLRNAREIAAGGEGRILEHPTAKGKVIKIYHQVRPGSFDQHLQTLSKLPATFIKPEKVYYDDKGAVAGFEMKYINLNNYWLFNNLFNKGFCTANNIDSAFKLKVLASLKTELETVHAMQVVIGDLNQYNLFVSKKGDIIFVDVDSFKTPQQSHSGVLLDDIRDWLLTNTCNVTNESDAFAYDILAFWATTFCHPFKWVVPGNTETLAQRVTTGKSILKKITGIKIPPLYVPPVGDVLTQFTEIFSNNRRYMVDFKGIAAPVNVVIKQQLTSASVIIRELYAGVYAVMNAGDFVTLKMKDHWVLMETKIPKVTRQVQTSHSTFYFPSRNGEGMIVNRVGTTDVIGLNAGKYHHEVGQPELHFYDGALMVVDYVTDNQYNYDLNNQKFGVACGITSVYSKSILFRDAPIQNFGRKKFLNVPYHNSYRMIPVPEGTKNAYHDRFTAVEYVLRNKVQYAILDDRGRSLDLDYFPFFTMKGDLMFLPENGQIQVYKDLVNIATMDVPNCSRDSRLYNTNAGILMLEGNNLYLLNSKA